MWIGNSMLWNWMDRNLENGRIWLLHSGAFYHVEKTLLEGQELPPVYHWFKWQSYITWLSGVSLLTVVFYLTGGVLLVKQGGTVIDPHTAMIISAALILLAWPVYNVLRFNAITGVLAIMAVSWGLVQVFNGRAAFLHVGAMMATIMTGNVFMVIMPSQRAMIARAEGRMELALRAKARSIHNNYLTFPVIALMLSGHFPSLYGHKYNWLLLCVIVLTGASVRHFMNIRFTQRKWIYGFVTAIVTGFVILAFAVRPDRSERVVASSVSMSTVQEILSRRCTPCHSAKPNNPYFSAAPLGITLETPDAINKLAPRIYARAVQQKTMPWQNVTGMTEDERALLGTWYTSQP